MADPSDSARINVGIVGAGYIARWHVEALQRVPGATLRAVCDLRRRAGEDFARQCGVAHAYDSLDRLLEEQSLDAAHVLVPPDHHAAVARRLLEAGVHVLLEKPMATSGEACRELLRAAEGRGRTLAVSHNFLFAPPYERLREDVKTGQLGPPDHVTITWNRELPQVAGGPFNAWMLRSPRNIMLEIGSHATAFLLDLVGEPDELDVKAEQPKTLPTGVPFYRRWRVRGRRGPVAIDLNFSFIPAFEEFSVRVRGRLGVAVADLANDTYSLDRSTTLAVDFDRHARVRRIARDLHRQAARTLRGYLLTKLKLSKRGNPYLQSLAGSVGAFYEHLRNGGAPLDGRLSGEMGERAARLGCRMGRAAPFEFDEPAPVESRATARPPRPPAETLVIGGTGFIGRELVRQLLEAGRSVRVLARNPAASRLNGHCRLEVVPGDLREPEQIAAALEGVDCVYHLAKAPEGESWLDYVRGEIQPTENLARLCVQRGVRRMIYTGTIASYYLGRAAGTIYDDTPLDRRIRRRGHYPRSKAACEEILLRAHGESGLGVVIFRPAIVIGRGAGPVHWGVGMWNGVGACRLWGRGDHPLPFVLVEDVAAALAKALDTDGIDGRTYNLCSPPLLSARQYAREIEKRAGVRIDAVPRPIWSFYAGDLLKWAAKVVVRHPDAARLPSYRDWKSRTHEAVFDCSGARRDLGWQPAVDVDDLIRRGIHEPVEEWLT